MTLFSCLVRNSGELRSKVTAEVRGHSWSLRSHLGSEVKVKEPEMCVSTEHRILMSEILFSEKRYWQDTDICNFYSLIVLIAASV